MRLDGGGARGECTFSQLANGLISLRWPDTFSRFAVGRGILRFAFTESCSSAGGSFLRDAGVASLFCSESLVFLKLTLALMSVAGN